MRRFTFGIEHEVAFCKCTGELVAFDTANPAEVASIIDALPLYPEDYPQLRVGRTGVRVKRWYTEGFDRYDEYGRVTGCVPKGIEIRTTPQATIQGALDELTGSFELLCEVARRAEFLPVLISFHPYLSEVVLNVPFNDYERAQLQRAPDSQAALFTLLTYGPDVNISCHDLSIEESVDIGLKYIFYSPYIIPFTYSSPFFQGRLWDGLSIRTFLRVGRRPVVNVFASQPAVCSTRTGALLKEARIPSENGRIEFKACDSCADFRIYAGLLALLKGLMLDTRLSSRAAVPDIALYQKSARLGFACEEIVAGADAILQAAERALAGDDDVHFLELLRWMWHERVTPAQRLIELFHNSASLCDALKRTYVST